jgi:glycosyltransferase involved in cell wall biosynthesis
MAENKICVLIPAYNEEKYITNVLDECCQHGYDVLVVDDGSTDNTVEKIKKTMTDKNLKINLVEHGINKGKGEALKSGFDFAVKQNYSGVITIDADGQHKVSEISDFLEIIRKENPDIIVGSRFNDTKGMPFIRLATNIFTSWLISSIAGKKINDVQSGFRYIGSGVLKNINLETKNFDTEPEILLKASWMNYKIKNVPISTIYHKDFVSHVHPVKDTIKFFKLVFKSLGWRRKFRRSDANS